jgi:hypothetical protein
VIFRPDRIAGLAHVGRIGRSLREQIHDHQPSATPSAGQADAQANGRVVIHGIGRGRVQHDEGRGSISGANAARQEVAVLAARRDDGVPLKREYTVFLHGDRRGE